MKSKFQKKDATVDQYFVDECMTNNCICIFACIGEFCLVT